MSEFSIEEFEAKYAAAQTKDEQFAVLKEGIAAYSLAIGVACANFMEAVEKEEYGEAAAAAHDMGGSLASMSTGLMVIGLLQKMRDKE